MIFTVGHSTRPIEVFLAMLRGQGVTCLIDVRTIPGSRRNPQFGQQALAESLEREGIAYLHLPGLGGRRKPRADSINTAWRNDSFRGYADHMQTPEFRESLDAALAVAQGGPVALMCAEAVPWRCHRSLIADALTARGIEVRDIVDPKTTRPHKLTPFARIEGSAVTYPGLV